MLDPRTLQDRRDEIVESCKARSIDVDIDSVLTLHARTNEFRTALNEANRLRNEHQKAGMKKLDSAEREAHSAEGRRLKDEVATHEDRLREAEAEFETTMRRLPNFMHPKSPRGHEEDFGG